MKVLKVFVDFADAIEELNDAERGRLFMAMLEYARSGAAPVFRGAEKVLWPVAKGNIDNQRRAYEHVCGRMFPFDVSCSDLSTVLAIVNTPGRAYLQFEQEPRRLIYDIDTTLFTKRTALRRQTLMHKP